MIDYAALGGILAAVFVSVVAGALVLAALREVRR